MRGPARQGDLYRAALEDPTAIGLIDGYFEAVPSVWHKEILWALSRGIVVYGAASIGALRAVECARFGMIGVGRVFEAYRDGRLDEDDEVALLHGPPETGYLPLTEAMVNIRATLARAVAEHIIDVAAADTLTKIAKAMFYKNRTWAALLALANTRVVTVEFATWLPRGRLDQKRLDALELLAVMRTQPPRRQTSPQWELAHSAMWDTAQRAIDESPNAPSRGAC